VVDDLLLDPLDLPLGPQHDLTALELAADLAANPLRIGARRVSGRDESAISFRTGAQRSNAAAGARATRVNRLHHWPAAIAPRLSTITTITSRNVTPRSSYATETAAAS
jgi:hypothetical protein